MNISEVAKSLGLMPKKMASSLRDLNVVKLFDEKLNDSPYKWYKFSYYEINGNFKATGIKFDENGLKIISLLAQMFPALFPKIDS
ncbi:MAG: hypothetical protein V4546_16410 [Bacteroidota bacterium]